MQNESKKGGKCRDSFYGPKISKLRVHEMLSGRRIFQFQAMPEPVSSFIHDCTQNRV